MTNKLQAIVHAWNDRGAMARATAAGYSALNSQGWYLDHLSTFWSDMYLNDPMKGVAPGASALVLGGQGEMWGETVDTSDIEQTVWPRLAAIAEQLWSPTAVTNATNALGTASTPPMLLATSFNLCFTTRPTTNNNSQLIIANLNSRTPKRTNSHTPQLQTPLPGLPPVACLPLFAQPSWGPGGTTR